MAIAQAATRDITQRIPPQTWFAVSAVFHYLGPSFAVLLFSSVGVLGVAWMRIASAALIFAPVTRPWRLLRAAKPRELMLLAALGGCLALMNCSFYLALSRLPISLVAAIEFLGVICLALFGLRTLRNGLALGLAVAGVCLLIGIKLSSDLPGLMWAFLNGALFVLYIILGHRIANAGGSSGIERLGAAMSIAFVTVSPIGFAQAARALSDPMLVLAGVGVGVCSSVIPYVCDQLAMARLPRATFALMLTLLPASAVIVGAIVLRQIPRPQDLVGIAFVMAGVGLHRPRPAE